ncbi:MAG: transporter substrate-binding domain-containing protein [Halopseudomonas sp.]|uniref:substrate-binding periplasmic protein n=1 Tax=Halopseudomonas sp. TaxID=2901191 RepID=UPI003001BB7F
MKGWKSMAMGTLLAGCAHLSQAQGQTLTLGFGINKPPYVYEFEARGLEFEIVAAALREAGDEMRPYYAPLERLHLMLQRGELDAIAATSPASAVKAYYSDSYLSYQNVAITLARDNIELNSIADLSSYSVSAFQRASHLLGNEFGAMVSRNPRYREEARQVTRNLLLYSGRVQVVVADERIFAAFQPVVADQVDITLPITRHRLFAPTPYSVGFSKPAPRDRFNQGLAALRESGEYARIMARYSSP